MDYDDIVIGSGLSALGTVLGLPADRRVLVIGSAARGPSCYYDHSRSIPCASLAFGGLGNYWHGVIPTGGHDDLENYGDEFHRLFRYFYPQTSLASRVGRAWLFVPWRPIRPQAAWRKVSEQRGPRFTLNCATATRFSIRGNGIGVSTDQGDWQGARLWLCAGALHTPALIERSLGVSVARGLVSDHVICYLGQLDRRREPHTAAPAVQRTRDGMWLSALSSAHGLCTLRPARFDFRHLDRGIARRAAFSLPAGKVVARLLRGRSAGLLAEALFNRLGMFPAARWQSVYAQVLVPDAHRLTSGDLPLVPRTDTIRACTDLARGDLPWPTLVPSQCPGLYIPGIHLHDTLDRQALRAVGIGESASPIQVQDASMLSGIGTEHHSFKMMALAAGRARRS